MSGISNIVGALIDRANVSFIGSVGPDGFPNVKAMLPPRMREGIRIIYYSTNTSSMRAGQFRKNPKACVYFHDRENFVGVMLKGTMEVLEDSRHKEMLWETGDEKYYPGGIADPDYCVLRFTAVSVRRYDGVVSEDFDVE